MKKMILKIKNIFSKLRTTWNITLTNTPLHFVVAGIIGLILGILIYLFIVDLIIFTPIAFLFVLIGFELAQRERIINSGKKWNIVDAIVDIIAGIVGFLITYSIVVFILRLFIIR